MHRIQKFYLYLFILSFLVFISMSIPIEARTKTDAAYDCLSRIIKKDSKTIFEFQIKEDKSRGSYFEYRMKNNKVFVTASSPVDLTRGAYNYLSNACNCMVSWSGNHILIPAKLPEASKTLISPFGLRYYMNVVTHGYSTAFWDWKRWEQEIDWMAVHGINMPLIPGAHEAILKRVFEKLGLTDDEIKTYFTGPAFLPWNRMGNINGWDGPLPGKFFDKQLALSHLVLNRLREMGMHPIIHAFAGFVPGSVTRIFPDEKLRELEWGGFNKKYHAYLLDPASPLFNKIGKLFITEWEKEFGKEEYYLADCFNEMAPPLSEDGAKALTELTGYGKAIYNSINEANPNATWVMQGWTFLYFKDKEEKLFWNKKRLNAFLSGVPNDRVLVLDLTNEYTRLWWKLKPAWEIYRGFFGKKWIYGFIPVMGGRVPYNGRLDIYTSISTEALRSENKNNLVGFGFAPEGIENNEIIYELLSDMAWRTDPVDLDIWIEHYCKSRYGSFPDKLKTSYNYLLKSVYGDYTDRSVYRYQFGPIPKRKDPVPDSSKFGKGVEAFLSCKDILKKSELYKYDAIEVTAQYLGLKADELLYRFQFETHESDYTLLEEALEILKNIDRLYESHPTHKLGNWIAFAEKFGSSEVEKRYYISNAKRLVTTWGGDTRELSDYSARMWSGLIRDYYIPRWKLYYDAKRQKEPFKLSDWEELWITTPGISRIEPFPDPVKSASELFNKYYKSN